MKLLIQIAAVGALLVPALAPVAAQSAPPRETVKELLVHAPDWVKAGDGVWEGMRPSTDGWVPTGSPLESSEPVFNKQTFGEFTRDIYHVSFSEAPPACPDPRTASFNVVFENYAREIVEHRPNSVPVLVSHGAIEKQVRQERWEYDVPN